jgi:signal transduction histidine kinase
LGVISEKKFKFNVNLKAENEFIEFDKDRILQVVLNFLSNAVKFAQKEIIVETNSNGRYTQVAVFDDGKGVPAELREAIFEKFFQAENQTIRKPKGSGLGLAISKKIIQYHKGNIGVERKEGLTKFYFTLPNTQ